MQRFSRATTCQNPFYHHKAVLVTCLLLPNRTFAARRTPGFGATAPPSIGSKAQKIRKPKTGARQAPNNKTESPEPETTQEGSGTKIFRRLRIGPGKILIFGVLAYLGYQIYIFQTDPHRSHVLNPRNFAPFILHTRQKISSTCSILNLYSVPKGQNTDNVTEAWRTGIWSLQVMQPELQIARLYTPLPPAIDAEPEQLRLLVRKEPQGEVSGFLHRISRGTLVHLRGPRIEYPIPQDLEEVLFLAGGTGIAPALQVAHILYNSRPTISENGPRLRILWANRRSEDSKDFLIEEAATKPNSKSHPQSDIAKPVSDQSSGVASPSQNALIEEVESLQARHTGKVSVEYFVDDESSFITERVLRDRLGAHKQISGPSGPEAQAGKKLILISGPEGFVDFYAGPKSLQNGREVQGPLGGMLQKINPQGWEIWKL